MNMRVGWLLVSLLGLTQWIQENWPHTHADSPVSPHAVGVVSHSSGTTPLYDKVLRFNVYRFLITAPDSGQVRELTIKAYRGELLLTSFRVRVDGAIVGAEVADLDKNRFPELYVYSISDGSGSFGRVYAWQFLPERKADIAPVNWQLAAVKGYMGHDSLWVGPGILCRKYPLYQPGDANAQPSGGYRIERYRLQPTGVSFRLVAEN